MSEQIETSSKKGRGKAQRSLDLISAMYAAAKTAQPITGRGIGYKLFTRGLIASMAKSEMQRVYRLLKEARENEDLPWHWIVDESRAIEIVPTWANPAAFVRCVAISYRRNFWDHQPVRVQCWSEKGTVRGVCAPVLDELGVGFLPVHGFNSATAVHEAAEDDDGRELIILYIGDYDPSGMYMSEVDLPKRFAKYGGAHITVKRIALTREQCVDRHGRERLPSFPATDKKKDPRYDWFVRNYGKRCWELDAMDPNDLRACVEQEIWKLIEPVAWERCERINAAEQESLRTVLDQWGRA
jgi:hypothetical protein